MAGCGLVWCGVVKLGGLFPGVTLSGRSAGQKYDFKHGLVFRLVSDWFQIGFQTRPSLCEQMLRSSARAHGCSRDKAKKESTDSPPRSARVFNGRPLKSIAFSMPCEGSGLESFLVSKAFQRKLY